MGSVYRKTVTKPVPEGAEIITRAGVRYVKWKDAKGKNRTAPLTIGKNGQDRISFTSRTYVAEYRDGQGVIRVVSTGLRDKELAERFLANLTDRAYKVRAGIITTAEDAVADYQAVPLAQHFKAYLTHLESEGTSAAHRENVERCLNRVADGCDFTWLRDLDQEPLEKWQIARLAAGVSARTRNLDQASLVAFCNWCIPKRMTVNPFAGVKRADEDADPRRKRRAMTEAESVKLLRVAACRPLAECGRATVTKKPAKGQRHSWSYAPMAFDDLEAAMERGANG